MHQNPRVLAFAIILTATGVGWLLMSLGLSTNVNWVWTLLLAGLGIVAIVMSGGLDKFSVVAGPFFLAASGLSILRQSGRLSDDVEVPILVIIVGVLLFVAQTRYVPVPRWFGLPPDSQTS